MQPRSLKIFKKRKGIYISPKNWAGICCMCLLFLIAYLEEEFEFDFYGWGFIISGFCVVFSIGLMISTYFSYEREVGVYCGNLTLWENKVQVDEDYYDLDEIKLLDFSQAFDIRGMLLHHTEGFSNIRSNGLDNVLILELKNGKKLKCNFLQTEQKRLKHFKEVLIHYHKNGIMGWLTLLDLLEIDDYDKIQEFKKEIRSSQKE